jgi:hypothetical protein
MTLSPSGKSSNALPSIGAMLVLLKLRENRQS